MKTYPFKVIAPEDVKTPRAYSIRVRIDVPSPTESADVIGYLRSFALKQELERGWMREHAPQHGLEIRGAPTPVTEREGDLSSPVIAYEQEFRLCQRF